MVEVSPVWRERVSGERLERAVASLWRMEGDAMTARLRVVDLVHDFDEACRHARGWMEPGTCCPGTSAVNPCRHPPCIARAERYSYEWARKAVHIADELQWLETQYDRY